MLCCLATAAAAVATVTTTSTVSTWTGLKGQINSSPNAEITLNASIALKFGMNQTVIPPGHNVTIIGNGHIIDAGGHETKSFPYYVGGVSNLFDVLAGSKLTLIGPLTVKGGNAPDNKGGMAAGGGAVWVQGGTLIASKVTFFDNVASFGYGGAITCVAKSTLDFTDCTFESNFALYGGAIALYFGSVASFENCFFEKNGINPATKGRMADTGGAIKVAGEGSRLHIRSFGGGFSGNQAIQGISLYADLHASVRFDECSGPAAGGLLKELTFVVTLANCSTAKQCCAAIAELYADSPRSTSESILLWFIIIGIISLIAGVGFCMTYYYRSKYTRSRHVSELRMSTLLNEPLISKDDDIFDSSNQNGRSTKVVELVSRLFSSTRYGAEPTAIKDPWQIEYNGLTFCRCTIQLH
jgi:hypothetical protein